MSKNFILIVIPLLILGIIYTLSIKILLLFILPLLSIIISLFIYVLIRNKTLMNKFIDESIKMFQNSYGMNPIDIGDFYKMTIYGIISFYSKAYHLENFGTLCVMTFNIGIMQMLTISINPFEKDLPQISIDIMFMLNKRISLFELYGLMLNKQNEEYKSFINTINGIKDKFQDIPNYETKKSWHSSLACALITKAFEAKQDPKLAELFVESIKEYIKYSNNVKKLNNNDIINKISLIEEFGNNLIDKGGISTDQFKKNFGIDKTRKYFGNVLFGYDIYKDMITK